MIGKVVTGCVAILPYHTATQDRGSECRDFGFISRIVTALLNVHVPEPNMYWRAPFLSPSHASGRLQGPLDFYCCFMITYESQLRILSQHLTQCFLGPHLPA